MEYKPQQPTSLAIQPRIIIHGGAGNITPTSVTPELYREFRDAILTIVSQTDTFMRTPRKSKSSAYNDATNALPTALETATYAVTLLENNPLFNAGHGAVFTRDGINELEASVMVSRGHIKRGVGVMGLRRVKNPIQLAKVMLARGYVDLQPHSTSHLEGMGEEPDVPSAQGHCQLHGPTAEKLAEKYGLEMVDSSYFYTKKRWDEHIRALEREKQGQGISTWSAEEYLPQGTCGAVALDKDGVLCVATSTGGLTNKLTGRIGDTPSLGAGFWAEEWVERGDPTSLTKAGAWNGPTVSLSESMKGLLADCLPTPFIYTPLLGRNRSDRDLVTTRSVAASGTGNGDSFLRTAAVRTVAAIARYGVVSSAEALRRVTGPNGELQLSAGSRWGKTGEGEGGMIGIECVVVRDREGNVVHVRSEILQDYNCGGMFRGWVDDEGSLRARVWRGDGDVPREYL
ncbi:Nucleophile aminohydrolase [Naviculisporaceae sp. PSN 640]